MKINNRKKMQGGGVDDDDIYLKSNKTNHITKTETKYKTKKELFKTKVFDATTYTTILPTNNTNAQVSKSKVKKN